MGVKLTKKHRIVSKAARPVLLNARKTGRAFRQYATRDIKRPYQPPPAPSSLTPPSPPLHSPQAWNVYPRRCSPKPGPSPTRRQTQRSSRCWRTWRRLRGTDARGRRRWICRRGPRGFCVCVCVWKVESQRRSGGYFLGGITSR